MQKRLMDSTLINQEQRTVKWFLTLFYVISISFDIFYRFILPKYADFSSFGFPSFLGYWLHAIMLSLLVVVYYLSKKGKQFLIKYYYVCSYIVLTIIHDIIVYWENPNSYDGGNIVEVFIVLFSPIFVNKRFFWLVSFGMMFKYTVVGFSIQYIGVMLPIMLIFVFTLIAYILLIRFEGYVSAIKNSFDIQLEGIVKGVIATLELKDPYTRGHSERVATYALILAKATGKYSSEELKEFNYSCLLHDIGKINIPDQILMKPSRLTDEEYEVIKTHPSVGAEAVKGVEGLNGHIDVIRYHHERWDGTGYPEQLSGKQIPFLARIVSIADAFDAMTSSRSYRAALSVEEAFQRILDGKGTQFDPELIEIFESTYPKWYEFHQNYLWSEKSKQKTYKEIAFSLDDRG